MSQTQIHLDTAELLELDRLKEKRPELFKLILDLVGIASRKGQDYSSGTHDHNANLRACEEIGLPSWKGVLLRMMDKWSRIKSFAVHNFLAVTDESFEDTLFDNSLYSLLCIQEFRRHKSMGP